MSTSVAKVYSHFNVSTKVNKVAIFYGIVLISVLRCSFRCTLSLCRQCVSLCEQHNTNSWPKRTEWSEDLIDEIVNYPLFSRTVVLRSRVCCTCRWEREVWPKHFPWCNLARPHRSRHRSRPGRHFRCMFSTINNQNHALLKLALDRPDMEVDKRMGRYKDDFLCLFSRCVNLRHVLYIACTVHMISDLCYMNISFLVWYNLFPRRPILRVCVVGYFAFAS